MITDELVFYDKFHTTSFFINGVYAQQVFGFLIVTITVISRGNSSHSSAIWKKHARASFSKTIMSLKNSRVYVFQIARETILLLKAAFQLRVFHTCVHARKS